MHRRPVFENQAADQTNPLAALQTRAPFHIFISGENQLPDLAHWCQIQRRTGCDIGFSDAVRQQLSRSLVGPVMICHCVLIKPRFPCLCSICNPPDRSRNRVFVSNYAAQRNELLEEQTWDFSIKIQILMVICHLIDYKECSDSKI